MIELLFLLINYLSMFVLPAGNNIISLTISALFFYFLFAVIAYYVDKKRT